MVLSPPFCAQLCPILCQPRTVARQAPLSMEFSRQEYWNLLFPFPGNLLNPGIGHASLCPLHWLADSLPIELPKKYIYTYLVHVVVQQKQTQHCKVIIIK